MITIKTITAKNFMSIGNNTQAVDFNQTDLTLVLGENFDLGGNDAGARNGTGKTTIANALSYALFGNALTNIKKDNLINRTNAKHMLVTVEFDINGREYKIERGRKPNTLAFYVEGKEQQITDEAQGDSRETQAEIERLLGFSHDMFKHIIALNTYTEPFLSLRANDQRTIIEQLLGITLLSEKAEALKEQSKEVKDAIKEEEYRIKAVTDANERIKEQITSLERRQRIWLKKKDEDLNTLEKAYKDLAALDIDTELDAHKLLVVWNQKNKDIAELNKSLTRANLAKDKDEKLIVKLEKEITDLKDHKCYACGQELHDEKHQEVLDSKLQILSETQESLSEHRIHIKEVQEALNEIGELGTFPTVFYDTEEEALEHKNSLSTIELQLQNKLNEADPYVEQIADMRETALEVIDYENINSLNNLKEHQDFLLKLLTGKDSFIRKRIIDQNLSYLNSRLGHYLDKIGLPHTVKFNNDLSVSIEELGRDLDFDNLSRGERNRLILSLSWSFRDVWESLYQPINLLFIDELVDSGLDSSGMENTLAILKKFTRDSNKSVWLVSHRDELVGRVGQVFKVIKENGYTTYDSEIETI